MDWPHLDFRPASATDGGERRRRVTGSELVREGEGEGEGLRGRYVFLLCRVLDSGHSAKAFLI
jgi:hypothetical protein